MKTKLLQLMLIIVAGLILSSASAETFYVAPGGNDGGAGTIGDPWATLNGARLNVQPYLDGTGDITVYFRGGTYNFTSTVTFGPSDSGTSSQSVNYAAYSGETPVFTSLQQVTGWTTHSGSVMKANLPGGISRVRYLHDESENWLEYSSTDFFRPNIQAPCGAPECEHWEPGSQDNKSYTIYPSSFSMPDASKASQYDLRAQMAAWHAQVMPITSINTGSRRIDVGTPSHYPLYNGIDDLITECWVLNSIAGIDTAGEWACIDGKIYLWPLSGTSDIYAPAIQEMIRVDAGGSGLTWTGTPVQYINFDGITFTGCDYRMSLASDIMGQHDWTMVDVDEGHIKFRNAANCNVTNCTFTKTGCDGVRLDRYAQNITVDNCDFSYMGKNGVTLTGRGPKYGDVNKNNTIINCHFNSTSRTKWDCAAVHIDQSSSNLVKQCYFEDLPMSAIIVSGCRESNIWEMTYPGVVNRDFHSGELHPDVLADPDSASAYFYDYDNIVEECTFRAVHIGRDELIPAVSQDAPGFTNGMIYTTGRKAGGTDTFRKNYFYDCDAGPSYSHTWIFLGDGHEDYLDIHKNMSYDMDQTNPFEPNPWMSNNCEASNGCSATANVKLNCFGFDGIQCGYCQNTSYAGNIDFDTGSPGGSSSYVNDYEEMWSLLCPGILPGPSPLPGSSALQTQLASKINSFGGTVPTCGPPDTDPPTPNPATWATVPYATGETSIGMVATTGTDASEPVEYYFDETSGNPGGTDSGWQTSSSYTDTGLNASTQYTYTVQMRDSLNNTGTASSPASATTDAPDLTPPTPDPMTWASVPSADSDSAISMTATTASDPSGVQYYFDETTGGPGGTDSGWQSSTSYTDTGLTGSTQYTYTVTARDVSPNYNETAPSTAESATTQVTQDTTPPTPNPATWATAPYAVSTAAISMTATTGSDPSGVEYSFDETSGNPGGSDSGWQSSASYTDSGLNSSTQYTYRVRMRDQSGNQNTGSWSTSESATTQSAGGTWTMVDDADSAISYAGTWGTASYSSAYNGTVHYCETSGATASYTFVGVQVRVYLWQYDTSQAMDVYIDNQFQQTISLSSGSEASIMAYESGSLTNDSHTVRVEYSSGEPHFDAYEYLTGAAGDTDPPTPNPATFASPPAAGGTDNISMTATTGTDASGPVEYFFDETSGNPGGSDSGWQTSTSYTDTGLSASTQYTYTVQMRDSVPNTGTASNPANATTDAAPDTDPPTPNPATFASAPSADSDTAISMTATTGSDASGPVEYYFDETSGNPGGSDSGWQTSTSYTDTGLTASTQYTYTVQMRDSIPNTGTASSPANATTDPPPDTTPPTPDPATWASVPSAGSDTAVSMTATTATDPSGVEYYFYETSGNPGGSDSGWQDSTSYTDTGLSGSTQYCYELQARDKSPNQNVTAWSTNECATTQVTPDTTPPTPDPMTWSSNPAAGGTDNISMTATTASDPSGIQYYFDETTGGPGGTDSGWQASASNTDTGLSASTQYCYEVTARDQSVNLNETAPSSNQCATTDAPPDTTPPTPDPMTWASAPAAASSSQIDMTASTASDPSGVEYSFDETSGNPGATDSGWQSSASYSDTGLDADTQYTYRVRARDLSVNQNATAWSTSESATTDPASGWTQIIYDEFESGFGNWNDGGSDCSLYTSGTRAHQGNNAIDIQDNSTPPASTTYTDNLALAAYDEVKVDFWYYCYSMDNSNEDFWLQISTDGGSNWTTVEEWNQGDEFVNEQFYPDSVIITGFTLTNNTQLRFRCHASGNADDVYIDEVMVSAQGGGPPDTDPPTPDPATWASVPSADSSSAISMTATTGSDPSGVQYSFDETSGNPGGSDSGWQSSASYTDSGLNASTQYTYRVRMRDQSANQNTGSWSTSESATTQDPPSGSWHMVNNTSGSITYTGSWSNVSAPGAYQDDAHWCDTSGDASFTFNGTQIRYYSFRYDGSQTQEIYIDDQSQGNHSTPAGPPEGQYLAYESGTLSSGSHTIKVVAGSGEAHVDAFEYFGP